MRRSSKGSACGDGPGAEFLLAAVGYRFGEEEGADALARLSRAIGDSSVADALAADASYHDMEPLLHVVAEDCARLGRPLALPRELLDGWAKAYARESARAALIQCGAARVLGALEVSGIEAIPLKGFYLAACCYERKGARPFRDLDLLVKERDLRGMHRALLDAGFEPAPHRPAFVPVPAFTVYSLPLADGGLAVEIDIHTGMHWPAEYERRTAFRAEDIWLRAAPDRAEGLSFFAMCAEHLVITTLLDVAVNHRYARLLRFRDVAEVLRSRELDWEELAAQARRWRVGSFVAPGLEFLRRMDPACDVPEGLVEALLPRYGTMRAFLRAMPAEALPSHRARSYSLPNLLFFILADRARDRYTALAHIPRHLLRGRRRF